LGANTWRFKDEGGGEREATTSDLRALLVSGALLPSTPVWRDGMKEYVPAFTLPEFATAAIAAARRETPHVPTLRPDNGLAPPPPPRRKQTKTLTGIDSSEAANLKTALEDTEPQAPAPPQQGIPPAPRMPSLESAPRTPSRPPPAPVRGSAAVSSAAASLTQSDARPKSMPPPLPPRGPRAPILTPSSPPAPPKRTLVGLSGQAPSKPPPPPAKANSKPPPPARGQTMQMPAIPAPPAVPGLAAKREVPSPPKRQVTTPPTATPGTLAAASASPEPAAPQPAAVPAAPAQLTEKTEKLPATPAIEDAGKKDAALTGQRPLLGAAQLLATLGDDWEEENTVQMARANGELVHEPRSTRAVPPDAAPTLKNASKTNEILKATEKASTAKSDAKREPPRAAKGAEKTPKPVAAAEASAKNEANGKSEDPDSKITAELPRQKTLEMSLSDHEGAALSSPSPNVGAQRQAPAPVSKAPSAPPPAVANDRSSLHDGYSPDRGSLSGEEGYRARRHEAVEVPRRSIVGASLLWMLGLVTFYLALAVTVPLIAFASWHAYRDLVA